MIYTHVKVDLDNTISTVMHCLLNDIPIDAAHINFVPANQMDFPDDAILIDMQKTKHTTPSHLEEYRPYLPEDLIEEVNIKDSTGFDTGSLQMVLIGMKFSGMSDMEILQAFKPMVIGWMRLRSGEKELEPIYATIPRVRVGDYEFLKTEYIWAPPNLGSLGIRDGISGTIYVDKYNMGITRFNGLLHPDLSQIFRTGWFTHRKGFLFSWGTRKSPAAKFPPGFENLDAFIQWLNTYFKNYHL